MTTLTTLDILKKGRDLIADPARWTNGAYARTASGHIIGPNEENARCFCTVGAICRASGMPAKWIEGGLMENPASDAWRKLGRAMLDTPYVFNDTHTHPEVLAAWNRAIAAEEAKQ